MTERLASVAGKGVVVTGGSAGLGRAMAEALLRGGARVIVTGRDPERGVVAEQELRAIGPAWFVPHDASGEAEWHALLDIAASRIGRLDGLINNVGFNAPKPLDETSHADFLAMIRMNFHPTWFGVRAATQLMRQAGGGGSIVNISSMAALYANASVAPYCTAKSMVRGLSRAAAAELASDGIRVNTIYPGIFMTEMTERTTFPNETARAAQLARIPLGRFARPAELGPLACFLISDRSRDISGADFIVDGARTAW